MAKMYWDELHDRYMVLRLVPILLLLRSFISSVLLLPLKSTEIAFVCQSFDSISMLHLVWQF